MQVKLKGKSLKGKNRIREHGEWWSILERSDACIALATPGPFILVRSQDGDMRWIDERRDVNFEIVEQKD